MPKHLQQQQRKINLSMMMTRWIDGYLVLSFSYSVYIPAHPLLSACMCTASRVPPSHPCAHSLQPHRKTPGKPTASTSSSEPKQPLLHLLPFQHFCCQHQQSQHHDDTINPPNSNHVSTQTTCVPMLLLLCALFRLHRLCYPLGSMIK